MGQTDRRAGGWQRPCPARSGQTDSHTDRQTDGRTERPVPAAQGPAVPPTSVTPRVPATARCRVRPFRRPGRSLIAANWHPAALRRGAQAVPRVPGVPSALPRRRGRTAPATSPGRGHGQGSPLSHPPPPVRRCMLPGTPLPFLPPFSPPFLPPPPRGEGTGWHRLARARLGQWGQRRRWPHFLPFLGRASLRRWHSRASPKPPAPRVPSPTPRWGWGQPSGTEAAVCPCPRPRAAASRQAASVPAPAEGRFSLLLPQCVFDDLSGSVSLSWVGDSTGVRRAESPGGPGGAGTRGQPPTTGGCGTWWCRAPCPRWGAAGGAGAEPCPLLPARSSSS